MTKQKYKLSKRAQEYLKAQGGLQVPYEYPYQDNTSPFDLGQIDPSLFQAQQNQMVKPPQMSQGIQSAQPQSTIGQIGNSLPLIGSALKLGTGIYSLIQGGKEKRRAKRMEANAQRDLERRMKESRENDFYYTGQTSGSYSDYNKLGGKVMQQGGFMDFYQNQEQLNKQTQNIWTDYYDQYVEDQKIKAQQLQQQGLSDTIGGGIGLASSILSGGLMKRGGILSKAIRYQNGGLLQDSLMQRSTTDTNIGNLNPNFTEFFPIDDSDRIENERTKYIWNYKKENPEMYDMIMGLNPDRPHIIKRKRPDRFREKQDGGMIEQEVNEDLYSADFQSPVQQNQDAQSYFTEVMNKYQALDPQGSLENKAMSWIFEEEQEPKRYDVGDVFRSGSNYNSSSVIDQIKANESGGDYSVVNPTTGTTGAYQFNPKYWGTQIRDFMGMTNVPINQVMEEFKNNPQAQDKFMEYVVNNVYKPEIERLRPLAQKYGFSDDDLVKLLHYRGIGDTRKRLETGNFEVSQEEKRKYKNPDILKYLGK